LPLLAAARSVYRLLVGAWPFGMVEAVWTVVALRRWRGRVADAAHTTARPIACDMTALFNGNGTTHSAAWCSTASNRSPVPELVFCSAFDLMRKPPMSPSG
jgi:hypothetical protein